MAKKRTVVSPTGRETRAGFVSSDVETPDTPDYVVVELRYESPVAFTASKFVAPAAGERQAETLNNVLGKYDIRTMRSHFALPASTIKARVDVAATLPPEPEPKKFAKKGMTTEFIHSGFAQIVPRNSSDARKIARELNPKGAVWQAYVAPRPVPAVVASGSQAGSRNFEPAQGYLHAAPNGIGAIEAWRLGGGKGNGVTICDIEGNWNRSHEDLPSGITQIGGTVINDLGWRNHGTAVLGEIVGIPDARGIAGISHAAKARVHPAVLNGVFNAAGAITNAAAQLVAGDVILIELQATGPNGKYVAMQYWDDIYSAILAATAKGITVVEAAGNGDENFDLAIYNTGLQKDSGAIVVGAGYSDQHVRRRRLQGHRRAAFAHLVLELRKTVNVQAWGWHVTTLGYGDAQGGSSENTWYTLRFSGTSSASPIITGAVACLQGRAKSKNGKPMTPDKVRSILMATGTPQEAGPGVPLTQHIGPQPNLPKAMALV